MAFESVDSVFKWERIKQSYNYYDIELTELSVWEDKQQKFALKCHPKDTPHHIIIKHLIQGGT